MTGEASSISPMRRAGSELATGGVSAASGGAKADIVPTIVHVSEVPVQSINGGCLIGYVDVSARCPVHFWG